MSMLNQLPSSKNNYLNHVLDWVKVFEQCKTHQDNYSDKDSDTGNHLVYSSDLCLPDMTYSIMD